MQKKGLTSQKQLRRRRKKRIIKSSIIGLSVMALLVSLVFISRAPFLTLSSVTVSGNSALYEKDIEEEAVRDLEGYYLYFFPKKNVFLYPQESIKEKVKEEFPRIKTLSLSRDNLHTLHLSITERTPYALWCKAKDMCFFLGKEGFVFEEAPVFSGGVFTRFYGPLSRVLEDGQKKSQHRDQKRASSPDQIARSASVGLTEDVSFSNASGSELKKNNSSENDGGRTLSKGDPSHSQVILGKRFLSKSTFENLIGFLETLKEEDVDFSRVTLTESNDLELVLESGTTLIIDKNADFDKTLDNLNTVFSQNKSLPQELRLGDVQYVDLRFGNKVFYKPKENN